MCENQTPIFYEKDGDGFDQSDFGRCGEQWSDLAMEQYGIGTIKTITDVYVMFDAIKHLYEN